MRELDFSDCKWLRKYLSIVYKDYELDQCNNICHLISMLFRCTISYLVIFAVCVAVGIGLVSVLSLTTLILPDGWQASVELMGLGVALLCFITLMGLVLIYLLVDDLDFAPKWLSEPTSKMWQKVYQKVCPNTEINTLPKEKTPNKFIMLVKECYKSIKDITCVKVKL